MQIPRSRLGEGPLDPAVRNGLGQSLALNFVIYFWAGAETLAAEGCGLTTAGALFTLLLSSVDLHASLSVCRLPWRHHHDHTKYAQKDHLGGVFFFLNNAQYDCLLFSAKRSCGFES